MAIDTKQKRISVVGRNMPWFTASIYPPATGFDDGARAAALGLYAFDGTAEPSEEDDYNPAAWPARSMAGSVSSNIGLDTVRYP